MIQLTIISFVLSVIVIVLGILEVIGKVFHERKTSNKRLIKKAKWSIILFTSAVFVFLADILTFIPVCANDIWLNSGNKFGWTRISHVLQILGASLFNSIKLFVVDSDIATSTHFLNEVFASWDNKTLVEIFKTYSIALYVISPLFTYGILLNMLYNVISNCKLWFWTKGKIKLYIFSELNEKMISLAESIAHKEKESFKKSKFKIIFCSVENKYDSSIKQLISKIDCDGFHVVKNTIEEINFSKNKNVKFFLSGDNEYEKLELATSLLEKYTDKENFRVYLFSNTTQSCILQHSLLPKDDKKDNDNKLNQTKPKIKFGIVNEVVSVVNNELYYNGHKIFKKAQQNDSKVINIVLVGAGEYGTQMFKTLLWYCQVIGYTINFTLIDEKSTILSEYQVQFPEVDFVSGDSSTKPDKEPNYNVKIYSGIDVKTKEFFDIVSNVNPTYVFVSLGDDELNLNTAIKLREQAERDKINPIIKLSMRSSRVANKVFGATDHKKNKYNVEPIGDINSAYSYDCIIHEDIEEKAKYQHVVKSKADTEFWSSAYNYQSSFARTMHMKLLVDLGILKPGQSTKGNVELNVLEHERWNAYTRSIGYQYSATRNDLAKVHNYLVPFEELPEDIKEYDVYTVPEDI